MLIRAKILNCRRSKPQLCKYHWVSVYLYKECELCIYKYACVYSNQAKYMRICKKSSGIPGKQLSG